MNLTQAIPKIDSHFKSLLCPLLNSLGIFLIIYPWIKNLGFSSQVYYEDLFPLNQFIATPNNSIFLYIAGCVTIFLAGTLYEVFVAGPWQGSKSFLAWESLISLLFFVSLCFVPGEHFRWAVLLLRLGILTVLWQRLRTSGPQGGRLGTALNLIFYAVIFFSLVWYLRTFLFLPILPHLNSQALIKAAIIIPVTGLLIGIQSRFPNVSRWVLDSAAVVLIALLVFKNDFVYFDYSPFLGAVHDVMLGKDILSDVVVSYGFFNIYFVAFVFDLFHVQDLYLGLSLVVSFAYAFGYTAIYAFLRIYTKDSILSILFLFIVLCIDYYYLHIPIHWLPQSTFLRMGSYLPVFFMLGLLIKKKNKTGEWLFAAAFAFLFFWVVEYGVYMLNAFIGITVCRYIFYRDMDQREWVYRIGRIALFLFVIGVFLTARIWLKHHHWPYWPDLFYFQRLYSYSGLAMKQFSQLGIWVIPFFVYWLTIHQCLKHYRRICFADAWLFLSFLGLQSFVYFIGKGENFVLARVALPALILICAGIGHLSNQKITIQFFSRAVPFKYLTCLFLAAGCLLINDAVVKEGKYVSIEHFIINNPKEYVKNRQTPTLAKFLKTEKNFRAFQKSISAIQQLVPEGQPLLILSPNDTLYYIYSRRKSFFNNAFYNHFLTHRQIDDMVRKIRTDSDGFLFVDRSGFQCYDNLITKFHDEVFESVQGQYAEVASIGFLNIYKKIGSGP